MPQGLALKLRVQPMLLQFETDLRSSRTAFSSESKWKAGIETDLEYCNTTEVCNHCEKAYAFGSPTLEA